MGPGRLVKDDVPPEGTRHYTEREEARMLNEEAEKSEGFDVDFSKFRYEFGFRPVDLDEVFFTQEGLTNRELLGRLCDLSLESYNEKERTDLELDGVVKANWHLSAGVTYYITFTAIDLVAGDSEPKVYQTELRYLPYIETEISFCRPKP